MRSVKVKLGEIEYEVPHLTLGQIEELSEAWDEATSEVAKAENAIALGRVIFKRAFRVGEIIMRRATPKIEDFRLLECTPADLRVANDEVLAFCGLAKADEEGKAQAAKAD